MFSFGYKNLYEPKTIEPGPGFYEIREYFKPISPQLRKEAKQSKSARSITNNDSSFDYKLKNHHNCYQEYFPSVNKSSESIHKKQYYFSTSKRSDLLILPQISKGPQYYNIKQKKSDNSINIGSYSGRKPLFDVVDQLSQNHKSNEKKKEKITVHKINWASRRFKEKQQHGNHQFPFREYSYLPKEQKYGPGLIDYPTEPTKGNTFNKSPRFHKSPLKHEEKNHQEEEDETGGFEQTKGEQQRDEKLKSYFKELIEEKKKLERIRFKSPPKYQFPKSDTTKTSLYKRQQQIDKSLEPGPGYYKV